MLDAGGNLKAEHGTGVNMAPFVQREWGEKAFAIMWEIKELMDPHGILAPDIKLTRDQKLHIKNFKSHPKIEDVANPCVECGFCESVCPSRHLTTTPRQRIVIRREMARQPEDSPLLTNLLQQNEYDGINTCAVDSSCYIACPISIDTGKMVKLFRQMEQTRATEKVALTLAQHWDKVEVAGRAGLTATDAVTKVLGDGLGTRALGLLTDAVRQVIDPDLMYTAREGLPPGRRRGCGQLSRSSRSPFITAASFSSNSRISSSGAVTVSPAWTGTTPDAVRTGAMVGG